MPDLEEDRTMSLRYEIPKSKNIHKSMLLRGLQLEPPTLNRGDIEQTKMRAEGRGRSYGGAPLHRGRGGGHNSFRSDRSGPTGPPQHYRHGQQQQQQQHQQSYNAPPPQHNQQAPGAIPIPGANQYGGWGNYGAPPGGAWGGFPPPLGGFAGGLPPPPPGVRDAGSYVGPPRGQGNDYRGGGGGGRGGRGGGGGYGRDNRDNGRGGYNGGGGGGGGRRY